MQRGSVLSASPLHCPAACDLVVGCRLTDSVEGGGATDGRALHLIPRDPFGEQCVQLDERRVGIGPEATQRRSHRPPEPHGGVQCTRCGRAALAYEGTGRGHRDPHVPLPPPELEECCSPCKLGTPVSEHA